MPKHEPGDEIWWLDRRCQVLAVVPRYASLKEAIVGATSERPRKGTIHGQDLAANERYLVRVTRDVDGAIEYHAPPVKLVDALTRQKAAS